MTFRQFETFFFVYSDASVIAGDRLHWCALDTRLFFCGYMQCCFPLRSVLYFSRLALFQLLGSSVPRLVCQQACTNTRTRTYRNGHTRANSCQYELAEIELLLVWRMCVCAREYMRTVVHVCVYVIPPSPYAVCQLCLLVFFFIFSDTDIRIYACFPELCLPDPTSFPCCMAAYNASKCVS